VSTWITRPGAHLNPAVIVGLRVSGVDEHAKDVDVTVASALTYLFAQIIGAFFAWLACHEPVDQTTDPASKLGVLSAGPAIRNPVWNVVTEVVGTFVLVYVIPQFGNTPTEVGPLPLVVGVGAPLGGPTGFAINPARDPRPAHRAPRFCRSGVRPVATGTTPGCPSSDR